MLNRRGSLPRVGLASYPPVGVGGGLVFDESVGPKSAVVPGLELPAAAHSANEVGRHGHFVSLDELDQYRAVTLHGPTDELTLESCTDRLG